MTAELDEEQLRSKAEKRVEEVTGFKWNLIAYVVVNIVIFVIWLVLALVGSGTWFPWFIFPLAGWGIGVAFHGWSVYGKRSKRHEELVQQEMERMK